MKEETRFIVDEFELISVADEFRYIKNWTASIICIFLFLSFRPERQRSGEISNRFFIIIVIFTIYFMNNKNNINIFNKILRKDFFFFRNFFIFIFWFIFLLLVFIFYENVFNYKEIIAYKIFFIFIISIFFAFLFFNYLIKKIKNDFLNFVFNKKNSSSNDTEDTEVKKIKDDSLGRGQIVSDIVKMIENDHDETFTISLDGRWGEGKSSIINFVKEKFKDNDDFLFFDFNPWFFANEKSVIKGFFEELQKKHSFFSESKFLKEFITKNSEKLFKFKLPFKADESIQELKNDISKKLSYRKQKLIIIIDDIDRLPEIEEVLEVFKIIGIFQKLKNIIFLLSFDKEVVEAILKNNKIEDRYLEKLINFNFKIITKQEDIDKYFIKRIKQEFLGKDEVIKSIEKIYEELSMSTTLDFYIDSQRTHWKFSTLREVKRLLHSFIEAYRVLYQEVNIEDLFRLTIFKVFYLKIYNDISNNKDFYIFSSFLSPNQIEKEDKKYIEKYIENLIKDSRNKDFIKHNICEMFPAIKQVFNHSSVIDNETAEKEQRIFHRNYFHRYFLREILDNEVSDEFVINFIENWGAYSLERKKELYSPNNEKYKDFLRKIKLNIDKIKKDDYGNFIKENYKNLLSENSNGVNNYYEIIHILFNLVDYIYKNSFENKNIQEKKLNQFIDIVNKSGNLYFANYFVDFYKDKRSYNEDFKSFTKELKLTLYSRIEKELFIDKKDIIKGTNNIMVFINLIAMNFENSNQNKKIEEYLNAMFEKDIKYLIKLLKLYFGNRNIGNKGINGFAELFNLEAVMNFVDKNINRISKFSEDDRKLVNKLIGEFNKSNDHLKKNYKYF